MPVRVGGAEGAQLGPRSVPLQSILKVGVIEAARELLASSGRGFNPQAFGERDGGFYKNTRCGGQGGLALARAAPAAKAALCAAETPLLTEAEVEVKFKPPPLLASELARCGAKAVQKVFTDVYFDTAEATLTARDHWLRLRNGVIELKRPDTAAPARAGSEIQVDFYAEERAWPAIAAALAKLDVALALPVPLDGDGVAVALGSAGVTPFATLTTARTRFALELCGHAVHVDLDEVSLGKPGATYEVGEVELVAAAPGTAPREALRQVLRELGVPPAGEAPQVRGKVLEFIHRFDAPRWHALGASGLLADKLGPKCSSSTKDVS